MNEVIFSRTELGRVNHGANIVNREEETLEYVLLLCHKAEEICTSSLGWVERKEGCLLLGLDRGC